MRPCSPQPASAIPGGPGGRRTKKRASPGGEAPPSSFRSLSSRPEGRGTAGPPDEPAMGPQPPRYDSSPAALATSWITSKVLASSLPTSCWALEIMTLQKGQDTAQSSVPVAAS